MNNKTIALVIVAALAVAAVGVGIYYIYGNEDTRGTITFLIEDGESDPIWIEGRGNDATSAFIDACDKNGIEYEISPSTFGDFIKSIKGIENDEWTEETSETSLSWAIWSYGCSIYVDECVDGEWGSTNVGISSIESSKVEYIALVYDTWGTVPSVKPMIA